MEDAAFSEEFFRFLRAAVPTVDAAEALLLLQREPERWWSAEELSGALLPSVSLPAAEAASYLARFQANGLVAVGPDKRAQYRTAHSELEKNVITLAQAYRERPVTLIRVIYALRDSKILSFADAFKLKRS
ncbi:MAG TPA: hypothetical protein VFZ54_17660 [Burkholderiales bacterium]